MTEAFVNQNLPGRSKKSATEIEHRTRGVRKTEVEIERPSLDKAGRHRIDLAKIDKSLSRPNRSRSKSGLCRTLPPWKMLLRRSNPAQWRIRCSPWRVFFSKSRSGTMCV
jgi:hypothetical protein